MINKWFVVIYVYIYIYKSGKPEAKKTVSIVQFKDKNRMHFIFAHLIFVMKVSAWNNVHWETF